MLCLLREMKRRTDLGGLGELYPDEGPLRRELYPKHTKMFAAGAECDERAALGGNRTGKTFGIGGYETAVHLTGLYPHWWEGKRFSKKILCWTAGTKAIIVRNINQLILLGALTRTTKGPVAEGGLIPKRLIGKVTPKRGVTDAADQVRIRHASGDWENTIAFKSYEEGRTAFQAEAVDWLWFDEEPPRDVYEEGRTRLITTKGLSLLTLTPADGMTMTVKGILEGTGLMGKR